MSLIPAPIPAVIALWLLACGAAAQAASPRDDQPAHRDALGRKVYTAPRDLPDSGSVSDMLRGVPFVDIDMEGNVSLRGDPDVVILLDGKPSLELSDPWRALTLKRMPAALVQSIEIITGASAQFQSGGARGAINIVTKAERRSDRAGPAEQGVT